MWKGFNKFKNRRRIIFEQILGNVLQAHLSCSNNLGNKSKPFISDRWYKFWKTILMRLTRRKLWWIEFEFIANMKFYDFIVRTNHFNGVDEPYDLILNTTNFEVHSDFGGMNRTNVRGFWLELCLLANIFFGFIWINLFCHKRLYRRYWQQGFILK